MDIQQSVLNKVLSNGDVVQQANSEYPILKQLGIPYTIDKGPADGSYLEFWPPDEEGDPTYPRPKTLPVGKPGIQVLRNDTRPIDVLGDVVSHYLVNTDPTIKGYYQQFQQSLTPQQRQNLVGQYKYAEKNEGEKRPFPEWEQTSGLPAYFRGYAFQQWPNAKAMYTPEQLQMFDTMIKYLRGQK